MTRRILGGAILASAILGGLAAAPAMAQTPLRVGWCAKTVSSAAAPFAIANKMGWFGSFKVQVVPMPGSGDCVKAVATKEVPFALPSIEPLAVIVQQGVKAKIYYTAYQGNVYGLAVPADSPIKTAADLKGKKIGVIGMASASAIIARAVAAANGLDPQKDINIVVAGESAQTAALVRSKQVDALSQFDTQYALVENAGVPLRRLPAKEIDKFPSNGFLGLDETLSSRRADAAALARGYAKGTIFAVANPEAAIRILWEQFPQTKATSKSEDEALKEDMKTLNARAENWALEKGGVKRWGESNLENYDDYLDFLLKWGTIQQKPKIEDVVTNALIDEINDFDPAKVAADAKAYKYAK